MKSTLNTFLLLFRPTKVCRIKIHLVEQEKLTGRDTIRKKAVLGEEVKIRYFAQKEIVVLINVCLFSFISFRFLFLFLGKTFHLYCERMVSMGGIPSPLKSLLIRSGYFSLMVLSDNSPSTSSSNELAPACTSSAGKSGNDFIALPRPST